MTVGWSLMRFGRTIKASRRGTGNGRFSTTQKTCPHLPFVLFLGRPAHYFLPQAWSRIGRMHLQDGTGPNRFGFPCFDASYLSPTRWSDFRDPLFFLKTVQRSSCISIFCWYTIFGLSRIIFETAFGIGVFAIFMLLSYLNNHRSTIR